ncbi:diaminopropionate ammonia-lyase [Halanaerobium saccharolyticum]|uniref:Diaminopropionate ammonia-lyase n=1 Tax=Halanaerobium saccharolyticum TaxID=43595 RepID=A0A2T5RFJ8_9FIRM|nr:MULTISPECIES: diaminopropionate ammonia-lyase [Halanaerobium]OEG61855.1 MAG: diaminopropionate ammonia-lyase [Halanaerobium sp. MDAL1]PTV93124.1 diaminopropionate ammonia-lyase [Halanaerobium saccharolyticum]
MKSKDDLIDIKSIKNDNLGGSKPEFLNAQAAKRARKFHSSFKEYRATPLTSLKHLAEYLGIKNIYVKDESYRFNLNSFKVLGGTYAIAKSLAEKLDRDVENLNFEMLKSKEAKEELGDITFITATDGNHGKGIAWAANHLGHQAVIYLPDGSAQKRVDAIREVGGKAIVTNLNYDDTVAYAIKKAEENNWHLVQDTAWEGYEKIPTWIMQGYTTMAEEIKLQLELEGIEEPTHMFLQAGVGSMAGSILGYYINQFDNYPITTIIEPNEAACVFNSAAHSDGKTHKVEGDLKTDMAGLACGEANPLAWEILRDYAHMFISCNDYVSSRGMRILANPIADDKQIISGESGSVGLGLLSLLMEKENLRSLKNELQLDENSIVLIFNTEGATDTVNYRKIVWDGKDSLLD